MIDNTNKPPSCSGEGKVIYPQPDSWAERSGERKSYGSYGAHIKTTCHSVRDTRGASSKPSRAAAGDFR